MIFFQSRVLLILKDVAVLVLSVTSQVVAGWEDTFVDVFAFSTQCVCERYLVGSTLSNSRNFKTCSFSFFASVNGNLQTRSLFSADNVSSSSLGFEFKPCSNSSSLVRSWLIVAYLSWMSRSYVRCSSDTWSETVKSHWSRSAHVGWFGHLRRFLAEL